MARTALALSRLAVREDHYTARRDPAVEEPEHRPGAPGSVELLADPEHDG
jgi:hypothetical protein